MSKKIWLSAAAVALMTGTMAPVASGPAQAKAAAPAIVNHSGKWHSNAEKSYWTDGNFPKGFSLTIEMKFLPNKLLYHAVNDTNKAKLYINDFEASLDDQAGPLNDNPRFNQIRIRQLDPYTYQVLEQKDGDVIVGQYWRFSPDGKTLVRWGVGKSPEGKSKAFLEWFDRVD